MSHADDRQGSSGGLGLHFGCGPFIFGGLFLILPLLGLIEYWNVPTIPGRYEGVCTDSNYCSTVASDVLQLNPDVTPIAWGPFLFAETKAGDAFSPIRQVTPSAATPTGVPPVQSPLSYSSSSHSYMPAPAGVINSDQLPAGCSFDVRYDSPNHMPYIRRSASGRLMMYCP